MKRWIASYIASNGIQPVLDLCCGIGTQGRLLSQRDVPVWGLDLDREMLIFARRKYADSYLVCGDAAELPFSDNSFQAVILSYALHEKSPEFRLRMLNDVRRVLKPQGRLLCLDFENPWDFTSRLGRAFTFGIERMAGGEHFQNGQQFLQQGGLQAFLKTNGLKEERSQEIPWGNSRIVIARFETAEG